MLVDARAVVVEMAAGTVGLVDRCLPVDDVGIGLVTFRAIEIAVVIQRLIAKAYVLVDMRNPRGCQVAVIALEARYKVPGILAGGGVAVMTGRARAQDLGVINSRHWHPDSGGMAVLAYIGCENMGRMFAGRIGAVMAANTVVRDVDVIEVGRGPCNGRMAIVAIVTTRDVGRVLAFSDDSVVTGEAGAYDLGMVNRVGRCEGHIVVAVLADVGRVDMRRVLAHRVGAVMAAHAVVRDVGVVKVGRYPGIRCMTIVAVIAARYVRRILTFGRDPIVAGEAGADHLCVIHHVGRRKGHVVVAVLTDIGRIDMRRVLAHCFDAVVAAHAVVRDVGVVKVGRCPRDGRVAIVAVIATRNVGRVLAGRGTAVMTRKAGADNLGVVHRKYRVP